MISCSGCLDLMERPHVIDAADAELCKECANWLCADCGCFCPPNDRMPIHYNSRPTHAHRECGHRLTRTAFPERSSTLLRRSGPLFRVGGPTRLLS